MGRKVEKTATDPRHPNRKVDVFMSEDTKDPLDAEMEDSFPASDPPSHTPVKGSGGPKPNQTSK